LDEQRELYDTQSAQVEAWHHAHGEAMRCREFEDAIQLGLTVLANIRRHNERWAKDIERSQLEFSWNDAERFARLFRWWREKSESLLKGIRGSELNGFTVEGAAGFREACREVDLMSLDTDRVRESIESLQHGSGISFAQAMHGLRNSIRQ
jgi:hypothetical protein